MKSRLLCKHSFAFVLALLSVSLGAISAQGQTTSFTYQGRLTDGGTAANGNYDLQFALFDSLSGGTQVGSTQTLNTVAVSNGVFTVSLNFGANAFPGANRFLEISARPTGAASFTLLTPRQQITSTPYAVRSLIAATADTVLATGVSPGSANYIQNSTSQQSSSDFNITGNGTAGGTLSGNVVNATTQYNLNGNRILSNAGTDNLFAGVVAGSANTTGSQNSIFGAGAGAANSSGVGNSFFGYKAGAADTGGGANAFFGFQAGLRNTTGLNNNFFGIRTGETNTTGNNNAFFGNLAGQANTTGAGNAFFGRRSGSSNTTGGSNTFVGAEADFIDGGSTAGNRNTLLGANTTIGSGGSFNPDNATAIGANARVDQSNSLVLGSIFGVNNAIADTKVGIGTTAPTAKLSVVATGDGARVIQLGTERAWVFKQLGTGAAAALELTGDDPNNNNKNFIINTTGNVGVGTTAPDQRLSVGGNASKSSGGTTWAVFSDERLKNVKGDFTPGLKALLQLQPIRFQYKPDNALGLPSAGEEVGFSAQAVAKVLPEAVRPSNQGYLQLQSDPILWTMLNAIKEQQAQIEKQQHQIAGLKKLICRSRRRAAVCR
jgi:endosialidase-like protein